MQIASPTDPPSVAARRLQQIIETRFAAGLDQAPPVRASRPHSDPEALRNAYLDVLKLCLCDLAGSRTTSVARTQDGLVMSRELSDEQLRMRAVGMDWPLHGLTMVGLSRLDDLQRCVETIVRDGVPGDMIEAGSWRGGASLLMRATLDTLEGPAREVWVADSFEGFPESGHDLQKEGYDLSADLANSDFLAVPLEEVKRTFARFGFDDSVTYVPGFFQHTLPRLASRRWSLVRLDGDTYESIRVALQSLYPGVSPGGYVVIDDYLSLDECRAAVDDFRRENRIEDAIEEIDWSGVRWRRSPEAPDVEPPEAPLRADPAEAPQAVRRVPQTRVPAIEEVELREEMERLQQRLDAAEAETARLSASPVAGPRAWLKRALHR